MCEHPMKPFDPSLRWPCRAASPVPAVKRVCVCLLAACCLTACGRWVEVPPLLIGCNDVEEMKDEVADPNQFSIARGMLDGICSQSGGKFAGGLRCNKGRVQVQCK